MAEVDYAALKKGGLMRQKQKDKFSMRLKVVGGQMNADSIAKIGEVAKKYGKGYVHLTSRQGIEIPFISLNDIEAVTNELLQANVKVGVCGPRVRTVTACQGSATCPSGAIETSQLAQEIDERYFGRELPHKFKFGITGCKNNCLKAEENDMGIKGGVNPAWDRPQCTFCGLCEAVCPVHVISVDNKKSDLTFEESGCVYCGKCVQSCPTGAWQGKNGYILSFGGMFGNEIQKGLKLLPILFDKAQLFKVADAVIEFYQKNGNPSERFGRTLSRVGITALKKQLEELL